MYISHFAYQIIRWWLFGLFPLFGCYEYGCCNICVQVFCVNVFLVLLGVYLEVKLLGQMVTLCLTFWNTVRSSSNVSAPFYNPISSSWWLQFLHLFQNIRYLCFDCSSSSVYKVASSVSICISLMTNDVLIGHLSWRNGGLRVSILVWKLY